MKCVDFDVAHIFRCDFRRWLDALAHNDRIQCNRRSYARGTVMTKVRHFHVCSTISTSINLWQKSTFDDTLLLLDNKFFIMLTLDAIKTDSMDKQVLRKVKQVI